MNQILYAEEPKRNKPIDKKKLLLFFAMAIAVFGIIIIIVAIVVIGKNKRNEVLKPKPDIPEPTISLTQEDEKAKIKIESEVAISQIVYSWDNGSSETLDETGKTSIEETIEIPNIGESTLNVTVIDSNGNETKAQEIYQIETSKPKIGDVIKVGNSIKITVTSEIELAYVSYRWNLDQEVKDDMYTYEDKKKYENTTEIPTGKNTLRIEAEDINGNKSEKTMELTAYVKAHTQVVAQDGYLDFTVTGEDEIEMVEFEINQKTYKMDTTTFGQTKVVHYKVKMENGWNYLKITSTTVKKAVDETFWKYEYNAENTAMIN